MNAYCTDLSGDGPQHAGINIRKCHDGTVRVNGKVYYPTGKPWDWKSQDGNTYSEGNGSRFSGPDGNWVGTCRQQD
jgi:hypothetical protein